MKLIPLFLLVGMLGVSGWAEVYNLEPYSPELVKKAEAGDPKAQFDLHRYFADKWGEAPMLSFWNPIRYVYPRGYRGEQNIKEAAKWLTKSAEQGYPNALVILGFYKYGGLGVTQDRKETIKLWTKAAEQGFMIAQSLLGSRYASGNGVPQDYKEAVKWYKKAAEQGYASAQFNLGSCYANGEGVTKDMKEAVKWWTKAAEQGDADAKEELERLKSK
jgi:TPR repeat protein